MSRVAWPASRRAPTRQFRRPAGVSDLGDWPILCATLVLAAVAGIAAARLPATIVLPGAAMAAGVAVLGPELLIVVAVLAGTGIVPFVDPSDTLLPGIKGYFLFFLIAVGTMLAAWISRRLAGRPSISPQPTVLAGVTLVSLVYALLSMAASSPLSQPTLAAPVIEFPLMAVVTFLWLSHAEAMDGVKRVLPVVVGLALVWGVSYIAASAGCGTCRSAVTADLSNAGLLGPDSRLFTAGQNTFIALVLVAFAQALRRANPLTIGLTLVGLTAVALQASRAQYIGVLAGMALLIGWQFSQPNASGRLALVAVTLVGVIAVLISPVGARAFSAYGDVSSESGTAGYRVQLVEKSKENWTFLGAGVTRETANLGVNEDLGLPNTIIVLGLAGAALQLVVLLSALWRGLLARTLAGATLAAIFLMVLVARPTLPLIEFGHSAITYGACVGVAAWLYVSRPAAASSLTRPRALYR